MHQSKKNEFLIVIPARYNSSRFPGKPLSKIGTKSMIQMVWEACVKASNRNSVIIATDDKRIEDHCKKNDMNYILTSKHCLTGTDRVIEVARKIKCEFYVNVQGDEPLISKHDIKKAISFYKKNNSNVVNCMTEIKDEKDFRSINVPKVVVGKDNNLMYMSRSSIPSNKKNDFTKSYKQVCIYCFPYKILNKKDIYNKKTDIEKIEDIEILRFIENNINVKMLKLSSSTVAVDTPSDLNKVRKIVRESKEI